MKTKVASLIELFKAVMYVGIAVAVTADATTAGFEYARYLLFDSLVQRHWKCSACFYIAS